jgi:ABC-2 type transport system ATP-binding protein
MEVKDLTKYYNSDDHSFSILHPVKGLFCKKDIGIKDISFKLYQNQILGITGAQACGKSTLLKLVCGIMPASDGVIMYCGKRVGCKELLELTRYITKDMSITTGYGQSLFEFIIQFTSDNYNDRSCLIDNAENLINDFGLTQYKFKDFMKVPSNIRNSVFVIKGLLSTKQILCFDQPYAFLDGHLYDVFHSYINSLAKSGRSIVISSANKSILETICRDIIEL